MMRWTVSLVGLPARPTRQTPERHGGIGSLRLQLSLALQ